MAGKVFVQMSGWPPLECAGQKILPALEGVRYSQPQSQILAGLEWTNPSLSSHPLHLTIPLGKNNKRKVLKLK